MGINLKNVFNDNEDELVVNRSKNAIRTLIFMSIAVVFVIIIAIIIKFSEDKDAVRRDKIIKDTKAVQNAVMALSTKHISDPSSVELIGTSLVNNPISINVNGIIEEYRYGYYLITPEFLGSLTNALNLPNEYYIVNYDTYDVINYNGVKYKDSNYYAIEDLLILEKGIKPAPKQIIRTVADLEKIRVNPNGYFRLSGNLDLSGYSNGEGWVPIEKFGGTLDGRGYTISNLTISRPSAKNVGLFGELLSTAKITNVTFENVNIRGGEYVGTLAGVGAGSISHINVKKGTLIGQTYYAGGLVGSQDNGKISNCVVGLDSINGNEAVGGIVGILYSGTLSESSASCSVGGKQSIGGAVGVVSVGATTYIQEVSAETTLTGVKDIGGLIGKIEILTEREEGIAKLDFADSYAKGTIKGTNTNSGGLVGSILSVIDANITFKSLYTTVDILEKAITSGGCIGYTDISVTSSISVVSCYWEKDLAPGEVLRDIGARANETFVLSFDNKSYDEMRIRNTFVGWNFDIWGMNERENPPYLKWQVQN